MRTGVLHARGGHSIDYKALRRINPLERSPRTDDDEFYIPRVLRITTEQGLLNEALGYIYTTTT